MDVVEKRSASLPPLFLGLIFFQALKALGNEVASLPVLSKAYQTLAAVNWQDMLSEGKEKTANAANKEGKDKKGKKEKGNSVPAAPVVMPSITKPVLPTIDWDSVGLVSSLKIIFDAAIGAAFPESKSLNMEESIITRCGNPQFGDFQCNNALGLSKAFKGLTGYQGKPKFHILEEGKDWENDYPYQLL